MNTRMDLDNYTMQYLIMQHSRTDKIFFIYLCLLLRIGVMMDDPS